MKAQIRYTAKGKIYSLDGREVSEEEFFAALPQFQCGSAEALVGWKPLHSGALCVNPRYIDVARRDAERRKVPTDFDKEGNPVFRTRQHRKEYLRAYGYHDRQGGYGD